MIKLLASLKKLIGRGIMPVYVDLQTGKYKVSVSPHGLRSLNKSQPFYNGYDIWLNVQIIKPNPEPKTFLKRNFPGLAKKIDINETLNIVWDLYDRKDKKIEISSTKQSFHLINKKEKQGIKHSYENRTYDTLFTYYKAIHIGRLWEFHRYDLRIETEKGKEILTEFTIRDIDEHGENYHNLVIGALISIVVSFVVGLLTVLFFK